jgi:tryptophan 2,3-dioxygenase
MAMLEEILDQPSLYDEALRLLVRNGFDIGAEASRTDWRQTRAENPAVRGKLDGDLCRAGKALGAV